MANRHKSYIVGNWTDGGPEHRTEDIARIRVGFNVLPTLAQELGNEIMWLVTNIKKDIAMDTIREAIGEDRARILGSGNPVDNGRFILRHSSAQTLHKDHVAGAILAVFPSAKTLEAIDGLYSRTSVIVVEFMNDARKWKMKWNPIDLLGED